MVNIAEKSKRIAGQQLADFVNKDVVLLGQIKKV